MAAATKTDSSSLNESTSSPTTTKAPVPRPNVLGERGHILARNVSKNSDPYQAEIGGRGEIQGMCFTPSSIYEQFSGAGMLVSDASVNSSRQTVDNSWQLRSSNGFTGEAAVRLRPEDWANAPAFVPGQKWQFRSFSVAPSKDLSVTLQPNVDEGLATESETACGEIPKVFPEVPENGVYMGQGLNLAMDGQPPEELCELCQDVVLSTLTDEERQKHITECIENHEMEMERSFAIQRSQEKTCGICMDVVWEKAIISDQRFGILSNCSHVFCLACIRKWRAAKQFENRIVRACPECRVKSDFVTPSRYWVEDKEDKKKLIEEYKLALSKKPCKYFDKGRGECPFNEKCFYLHALPDGRVPSPKPVHRRHRPPTASSTQTDRDASHMVLYEILDDWPLDRWEDLIFHLNFFELSLLSTSDEEDDDDDGENDLDDPDLPVVM